MVEENLQTDKDDREDAEGRRKTLVSSVVIPFLANDEKRRRIRERSSMPDGRAAGRRGMPGGDRKRRRKRERESPADGARWNERDRERERRQARPGTMKRDGKRAARSLGSRFPRLRSIPPPSLASLFPSSPPPPLGPLRAARSSFLLGPAVLLFRFLRLARSCSCCLSLTLASRPSPPLYPAIRLLPLLLLLLSFFLSFSADARFFTYNRT